jgi:hypothetical protein
MKPKHLFYGSAVLALVIALLYAIQSSVGLALLLLLVASCCLLNTRRAGSDGAASWADVKRMFGVR